MCNIEDCFPPCTVPSVPRLLSVTLILSDGFELNWLPPREPNGRPQYEIEYGTDGTNFTTAYSWSHETYYNLTGLQHTTTYHIRVSAVNVFTSNGVPLRTRSSTITANIQPLGPGKDNRRATRGSRYSEACLIQPHMCRS